MFKLIISQNNEPSYNLALEEYLLENCKDNYFLVYKNKPCIVCGRSQNIFEEINILNANKLNLPIFRRLSGGGTVYHDMGNINFSFIKNYEKNEFDDFVLPVIVALNKLYIPAIKQNKSDIFIDDKKVSGNAQCIKNNRILHHGTLLFNSDLNNLKDVLITNPFIKSKSIKSNKSNVTNISNYYNKNIDKFLLDFLNAIDIELYKINFQGIDLSNISQKYLSFDWIYKRNPKFIFDNGEISFNVEKGIILNISDKKLEFLNGKDYLPENILNLLKINNSTKYFNKLF